MQREQPRTLSGKVMDAIGSRIVGGIYSAGEALPPEMALCEEFGLSRTPLREAMKRLHAKGLISVGPKNGTKVLPPARWNQLDADVLRWRFALGFDAELIEQLYDLRLVFEPEASRLAALRARPRDRAAVRKAFDRMAALAHDPEQVIGADAEFHLAIFAATHNIFLDSVSAAIGTALKFQFAMTAARKTFPPGELELHRAICDAIIAGESEEAARSTRALIAASRLSVQPSVTPRPAATKPLENKISSSRKRLTKSVHP